MVLSLSWLKTAHSDPANETNVVASWGSNYSGQLGDGTNTDRYVPVDISSSGALNGKTITQLSTSGSYAVALCSDGTLVAWGAPKESNVPVVIPYTGALAGKTVTQIETGLDYTFALCSDGSLVTWGTTGNPPVDISNSGALAGKTVTQLAVGQGFNLALCSDGTVASWGDNFFGMLGDGTTTSKSLPVAITNNGALNGKTVTQLYAGMYSSFALCSDGTVVAWGSGGDGVLGTGYANNQNVPVAITNNGVLSGKRVTQIAVGAGHTLALCSDGTVAAWGRNSGKQLGDGTNLTRYLPVEITSNGALSAKRVQKLVAGSYFSLALCSDSSVAAWGGNNNGQLGDGSGTDQSLPVNITNRGTFAGKMVTDLFSGDNFSLAIATVIQVPKVITEPATNISNTGAILNGNVIFNDSTATAKFEYGLTTAYGSEKSATFSYSPAGGSTASTNITGLALDTTYHFRIVAMNSHGTSVGQDLTFRTPPPPPPITNKAIVAWGDNSQGQLGNNSTTNSAIPIEITNKGALSGKTVTQIVGGGGYSLALCSDGTVAAWGANYYGQLGDGTTTNRLLPVAVTNKGILNGKTVVQLAAGYSHTLALCSDGTIAAWGYNYFGQLGDGTTTNQLLPISITNKGALSGKTITQIAVGSTHSLAIGSDGSLFSWGDNAYGKLGDGTSIQRNLPVAITGNGALSGKIITKVVAGGHQNLALCSDGTLTAWGANRSGELGDGTTTNRSVPVDITNTGALSGKTVTQLAAGEYHCLALCSDGTLAVWGGNASGALGNGTTANSLLPIAVTTNGDLSSKTIIQIAAGYTYTLVLCSDGTIVAWGSNGSGQLGGASAMQCTLPVAVYRGSALLGKTSTLIAAGSVHALALATIIQAPTVVTTPATNITSSDAALNAIINPDGVTTTAKFEYGLTSSYGSEQTISLLPNNGAVDQTVSATISGLTGRTTYHFRASATNSFGTITGDDLTFTTPNALPQITNTGLRILEGSTTTIAPANLNATDSDGDALTFTVTTLPTLGSLKLHGTAVIKNGTFTPADIAAGVLTYTRTATGSSADVFSFKLADGYSTTAGQFAIGLYRAPSNILLSKTNLPEKAGVGAVVGTFSTVDADKGDTFTYTLVTGEGDTDNASFSISGATLKATASFNVVTKNSYLIRVRSTDAQGLFFEKALVITITDATKPTVVLGTPTVNQKIFVGDFNGSAVSGSAADNLGVSAVKVRLSRKRNNVNQYWNGTDFVGLNSTVDASLVGTTGVTWTLGSAVPPADKLDTGLYQIEVFATDAAGNKSSSVVRPFSITTDGTAPTVGLNNPLSNQQVLISDFTGDFVNGTASDDTTVSSVKVRLARKRNNLNEYWNGISFTTTLATVDATITGGTTATWVLGNKVPTAGKLDNGTYQIEVYALDAAGNKSASVSRSFTLSSDFTAPSVTITTPSANQLVNINSFGAGTLSGTAQDNKGVVSVKLKLQRTRSGATSYWNGTSFTSTSATVDASVSGTTNATWNLSTPIPASALDTGAYILYATAYDAAGNAKTSASRSFYVTGSVSSTSAISAAAPSSANGS